VPLSSSNGAIFLSYAREDAAAARRIAEALRAHGLEVWFDEDELRGGDAWDAKIRQQIRECALFVPVISANTQTRREGYFRREWRQAAERTRDMAEGTAFLLPVVIDETTDRAALVPEEFRAVQWTRLGGDEISGPFCQRVQALLPGSMIAGTALSAASPLRPGVASLPVKPMVPTKRRWFAAASVVAAVCVALFIWRRPGAHGVSPAATEKSIAVLPFVNMSPDRENEYLSDGITEEILNALVKVPGLRVPARTSSFVFKDRKEDIKKIGELLGVKTVLEGSVRRAGNQLRITAQLINVADGYHLWSDTYKRDMTNIFDIQDDIARNIVAKLKVTIAGTASAQQHRTENIEAYEEVLKGRFHAEKFTQSELNLAISHYKQALAKQEDYAPAWAGLSGAYGLIRYFAYLPPAAITPQYREATAKALQLDDTLSNAHLQQANLLFYVDRDFAAAEREFKSALALEPTNVTAQIYFASFLGALGRHAEAVRTAEIAKQLDPLSVNAAVILGWTRLWAGDSEGALKEGRRALVMAPDYFNAHEVIAAALRRKGRLDEAIEQLEQACRFESPPQTLGMLGTFYGRAGRKSDAQKVLDQLLQESRKHYLDAFTIARAYDGLGEVEKVNEWMNKAISDCEGRVLYLKAGSDAITAANPHFGEWLKKLGLGQ
jgi:TolB-like protein/Tfp pilus assembly protein PilF